MNKKMRKIWQGSFMVMILSMLLSMGVFAMDGVNSEKLLGNNDSRLTATNINVNTTYTAKLEDNSDEDWYKFTLPDNGYIEFEFGHDYLEESPTWHVKIYNMKDKEIADYSFDRYDMSYKDKGIGLPSGSYYVVVWGSNSCKYANYNLKINYISSDSWEKEFNETSLEANLIGINTTINGRVINTNDRDWYKFTLPYAGYIEFEFGHDYLEETPTWYAKIYNTKDDKEIADYSFDRYDMSYKDKGIGLPSGSYYVVVWGSGSCKYANYNFKVNYINSDSWEKEFNETSLEANVIGINKIIHGRVINTNDRDWYKFTLPSKGYVALDFGHDYLDESPTWYVKIYDMNYKEIKSYKFNRYDTSAKESSVILSAGNYYLTVWGSGSCKYANYTFKINYVNLKAPKGMVCGNLSSGINIKWDKVDGASGYYVYRKVGNKGSWKKIVDLKKASALSHLNKSIKNNNGQTYYYKVVAYNNRCGCTGPASIKKIVRIKDVVITSLKSATKSMTVKWKKNTKASGYEIQYSTNSKFTSGQKVITVSKKSSSKKIKKLTKNKTYYVRVRAYIKGKDKVKYNSAWSKTKKVKIKK